MAESDSFAEVKMSSERGFGLVFAAVFLIVGLFPLLGDGAVRWWSVIIAAAFAIISFAAPKILAVPNRLWFKFGMFLGGIVAPIVMALVFFLTVMPTGLIMRMLGKDLLRQRLDKSAKSYWIERTEPMGSMKNQF